MDDPSWLKNDPNRIAGGRPFTESFFTTVLPCFARRVDFRQRDVVSGDLTT